MSAQIIPFRASKPPIADEVTVDSVIRILDQNAAPNDLQTRYQQALPLAREFVQAWISDPEAMADFLAWAHARGALKF